jgi:hypothetical protein
VQSVQPVSVLWKKSSYSQVTGHCVEVAGLPANAVGVRDSRNVVGPVLQFKPAVWGAFLGGVRSGNLGESGR